MKTSAILNPAPERVLFAGDGDDDLIQVPFVAATRGSPTDTVGKCPTNFSRTGGSSRMSPRCHAPPASLQAFADKGSRRDKRSIATGAPSYHRHGGRRAIPSSSWWPEGHHSRLAARVSACHRPGRRSDDLASPNPGAAPLDSASGRSPGGSGAADLSQGIVASILTG
jgi:hypothetical protein